MRRSGWLAEQHAFLHDELATLLSEYEAPSAPHPDMVAIQEIARSRGNGETSDEAAIRRIQSHCFSIAMPARQDHPRIQDDRQPLIEFCRWVRAEAGQLLEKAGSEQELDAAGRLALQIPEYMQKVIGLDEVIALQNEYDKDYGGLHIKDVGHKMAKVADTVLANPLEGDDSQGVELQACGDLCSMAKATQQIIQARVLQRRYGRQKVQELSSRRIVGLAFAFAQRSQHCGAVCAAMQIGAVVGKFFQCNVKPSDSVLWSSKLQGLQHHYQDNRPTTDAIVRLAAAWLAQKRGGKKLTARICEHICKDLFVGMVRTAWLTGETCKVPGVKTSWDWLRRTSTRDLSSPGLPGARYYKTLMGSPGPELFAAVGHRLYFFAEGKWRRYQSARFVSRYEA